jgi:hypothetical protein
MVSKLSFDLESKNLHRRLGLSLELCKLEPVERKRICYCKEDDFFLGVLQRTTCIGHLTHVLGKILMLQVIRHVLHKTHVV